MSVGAAGTCHQDFSSGRENSLDHLDEAYVAIPRIYSATNATVSGDGYATDVARTTSIIKQQLQHSPPTICAYPSYLHRNI